LKGPKLTIYERKLEPLGLSIAEAAKTAGVGRTTIYEALASGRLSARKLGRRTIIRANDLDAWLAALPALKPAKA
jgi:excisionase family DNA binding protein